MPPTPTVQATNNVSSRRIRSCVGMSEEWDLMVSKTTSLATASDIPVITGNDYFSMMSLGKDRTHSQDAERNMNLRALMLEDAVNAAYAINQRAPSSLQLRQPTRYVWEQGFRRRLLQPLFKHRRNLRRRKRTGYLRERGAPTPTPTASPFQLLKPHRR